MIFNFRFMKIIFCLCFFFRYKMMLSCWQEVPTSRPLFDELQEMITNMLDKSVCDHYVLLNEPYQKMNVDRYNSNQIDYSTMLTPHRHSAQSTSASIQYSTSTFTKCWSINVLTGDRWYFTPLKLNPYQILLTYLTRHFY